MRGDVLWPLLFGSALTLATTLLAQWSSLAYQTRRQREARRADFQRSSLVQVRDLLLELSVAMDRAFAARYAEPNWEGLLPGHPAVDAITGIGERLRLLAAALDDERLYARILVISAVATIAAVTKDMEDAVTDRKLMTKWQEEIAEKLGSHLRKLP